MSLLSTLSRLFFLFGAMVLISSPALKAEDPVAPNQCSFTFNNGNKIIYSALPDNAGIDLILENQDGTATLLSHYDTEASLSWVEGLSSMSCPIGTKVVSPKTEAGKANFTLFRIQSETKVVFEDGEIYPVGRYLENNMSYYDKVRHQKFLYKGTTFLIQSLSGSYNQYTFISSASLSPVTLGSVFLPELKAEDIRLYGAFLNVHGLNTTFDMDTQKIRPDVLFYRNEAYSFSNHGNALYLSRERDKLTLLASTKDISANDVRFSLDSTLGILTISGSFLDIDMDQFDAEAKRRKYLRKADPVLDSNGSSVNAVEWLMSNYTDMVYDARANPHAYPEVIEADMVKKMTTSLVVRKSIMLLGKAGTGKSSAARAFAREVALGKVRGIPKTMRIFSVNAQALASGTMWRGEFEQRMMSLVAAAMQTGWIIFIDEFHSLQGTGTHSNSAVDGVQMIKPALELREMILIGTDTTHEYYNAYGSDPALDDRFEKIQVTAPALSTLLNILRAKIKSDGFTPPSESVLTEAVTLSNELDIFVAQPRAGVNLVLNTYAFIAAEGRFEEPITIDDLRRAATEKYGVNPGLLDLPLAKRLLIEARDKLNAEVIGQAKAKAGIIGLWELKLAGIKSDGRINSILLLGPPGVGKTKIAKASADLLRYNKAVIEMQKFSSPNYVEDFRREIYEALQRSPFSVIILDDFEKAHYRVQEAALSILDRGEFAVTEQRVGGSTVTREVTAKHCLFVLTSNAAANLIREASADGTLDHLTQKQLKEAVVAEGLSESLVSRIRYLVPMANPTAEDFAIGIRTFVAKILEENSRLFNVRFILKNQEEVLAQLCAMYLPQQSDFRDIEDITQNVVRLIAHAIMTTDVVAGTVVELEYKFPK